MSERYEEELAETLRAARARPPAGWEQRALEMMARAGPRESRFRLIAVVSGVLAMIVWLGLAPSSVDGTGMRMSALGAQEALAAEMAGDGMENGRAPAREGTGPAEEEVPLARQLAPYRGRAAEFARSRYADDAEMLMAAGLITTDKEAARELLERAASLSGSPVSWAAYAGWLLTEGPEWWRPARSGDDPGDPEQVAEAGRMGRHMGLPTELSVEGAAPAMAALGKWQAAEPENALPVALEMRQLYAMHRDGEALSRWTHAGSLPVVEGYGSEMGLAAARLLARMGMGRREAMFAPAGAVRVSFWEYAALRDCARIALWEGRLAQMEDRAGDAIAWWNGTIGLGRHMQESTDSMLEFLVGAAVQSIGAGPVWQWAPDRMTGIPGGPLLGGRLYRGEQHAFYVSQVGDAAAAEVRDELVKAKVRSQLLRDVVGRGEDESGWRGAMRPLQLGGLMGGILVWALVVFLGVGTWRRKQADGATDLGRGWKMAVVLMAVAPAVLGYGMTVFRPWHLAPTGDTPTVWLGWLGASAVVAVLLPLAAARFSRRPSARLATAWRGNLRETLPLIIALCGALALTLGVVGKSMEARWLGKWYREGHPNEMARVVEALGDEWTEPEIPQDAWRAEAVPEVER
jgi:hypothetical protein